MKYLIPLLLMSSAAHASPAIINQTLATKPLDGPRLIVGKEDIPIIGDYIEPVMDLKSKRDGWRPVAAHRGTRLAPSGGGCTKPSGVDFSGTPTECQNATQNPSFLWTTFFDDVRQSGQAEYYWNFDTIPYDVACVHVGCGYDTTLLVNDPKDVSFSATTATITAGVLTVNPLNLDPNNGNVADEQYLTCTGCPTSPRLRITANISPTTWQLDQNVTVSGSPAVTGSRYPQLNARYLATQSGISTTPIVAMNTTGDNTTPTNFQGYDMTLYGGVWLRISVGGGAGANGEAGPVSIVHNNFMCNSASGYTSIETALNTHFDFTVEHNQHDGRYPTCTGQAFLQNRTVGTISKSHVHSVQWNALLNEGVLPMSGSGATGFGGGYKTYMTVGRNGINSTNLSGAFHGAVYALNLSNHMYRYSYIQNTMMAYPASGPAGLGTTTMSMLCNASVQASQDCSIDEMEFFGNIAITNVPSVSYPGVQPCGGNSGNQAVGIALWASVDMNNFGTFSSRGNLTDPSGSPGCAIYAGGLSRYTATASLDGGDPNDGLTTMTVTANSLNFMQNSIVHVNSTPFQFCGTITYDGNGQTGTLTRVSIPGVSTAICGTNTFSVGFPVQGVLVKPGTYVSAVINSTTYTVKNIYCSGTSSCNADDFTVARAALWGAFSVMPIGTIDPLTGLPSTGTGKNTGTYVLAGEATDVSRSTYRLYNPTMKNDLPDVNDGTDMDIRTGAPTYLGGMRWSYNVSPF